MKDQVHAMIETGKNKLEDITFILEGSGSINLACKMWCGSRADPYCSIANPRLVKAFPWNVRARKGRVGKWLEMPCGNMGKSTYPLKFHEPLQVGFPSSLVPFSCLTEKQPSLMLLYMCSLPGTVSLSITSRCSSLLDLKFKELHFPSFVSRDPNLNSET